MNPYYLVEQHYQNVSAYKRYPNGKDYTGPFKTKADAENAFFDYLDHLAGAGKLDYYEDTFITDSGKEIKAGYYKIGGVDPISGPQKAGYKGSACLGDSLLYVYRGKIN